MLFGQHFQTLKHWFPLLIIHSIVAKKSQAVQRCRNRQKKPWRSNLSHWFNRPTSRTVLVSLIPRTLPRHLVCCDSMSLGTGHLDMKELSGDHFKIWEQTHCPALLRQQGCFTNPPVNRQCYFNDSDLAWLFEHLLHLSWDIFLSRCPCFHHLTHQSNHFNKAAIMLKRGLGGPDDIPINKAHRAKLFCASDSGDVKGRERRRKLDGLKEESRCRPQGFP